MTALALGADGSRMYAGNFAGVWRSDDGGQSWSQLTWPEPPFGMAQADIPDALHAPHVFAPDDPDLVYAVGTERPQNSPRVGVVAISRDAGKSWTRRAVGSSLWHVAVAPREAAGTRRVYAVGDSVIWYSTDGGQSWRTDGGVATIWMARQQPNAFQQSCNPNAGVGGFAGPTAYAGGDAQPRSSPSSQRTPPRCTWRPGEERTGPPTTTGMCRTARWSTPIAGG
jgi:BNR/Asp-box repeat